MGQVRVLTKARRMPAYQALLSSIVLNTSLLIQMMLSFPTNYPEQEAIPAAKSAGSSQHHPNTYPYCGHIKIENIEEKNI